MQILSQLVAETNKPPPPTKLATFWGRTGLNWRKMGSRLQGLMHITFGFHKMWAIFLTNVK